MSAVAHFFVAVSGSFIHERMAQLFIDIYTHGKRSDNTSFLVAYRKYLMTTEQWPIFA